MSEKKKQQKAPVCVGTTYTIDIQGIGSIGEGVGRYEGFTVFVPYALPNETVQVKITLVKKNYAVGDIVEVITPSAERVEPQCEVYGNCGGCQLQHASYTEQLRLKTESVKAVIERIAKSDPELVLPCIGPEEPWRYRNKMQMPIGGTVGNVRMGFYQRGSHSIINHEQCPIQDAGNDDIRKVCYDAMKELGIEPYDEHRGIGVVRHVVGRIGKEEWMVILVSRTASIPHETELVERIVTVLPKVTSIVVNHNPKQTNVILGPTNRTIYGKDQITDYIKDLSFQLSPHSFFQVNPEQTTVLYDTALEFADLKGHETVIDAYCGTGTISLFLAHKAKNVIGIEIVEPAIVDAKKNAERNGYTNTEFIVGDAAVEMPRLYKQGIKPDVIVFDPIRAGCKEDVLHAAVGMAPKRIVYVSCNPSSMARDIEILTKQGYQLVKVQPVDMFPQTYHVEAVALLSKLDSKDYISIEHPMDNMDLTSAESKATY